ncbi:MAG: tetratricopeptide repeat protein [Flavobacteriales bacterium]|nr:tetratricopeptide repeat protein [Flavobacteriales bacterium]
MLRNFTLTALFILTFLVNTNAQQSTIYLNSQKDYDKAVMLYHNKQYAAAQLEFENIKNKEGTSEAISSSSEYYASLCSVKLGEKYADKNLKKFIEKNPTSPHKNDAIIDIANYYYDQGKYSKSLTWFYKIDPYDLKGQDRDDFLFKKAYVEYVSKKYDKAKISFSKVFNSRKYGTEAKYYYAHIAYLQNNNQTALKYFEQVKNDRRYSQQVPFFISQIYFNQKKYQEAIDEALPLLKSKRSKQFSDLSKLVGESYFNLKDFDKSLTHLLNYKGRKGKFDNTHFYQIGYAYYQGQEYEKAISYFNKIISTESEVAQNAYYNLAACYLKLDKKNEALNAFGSASMMEYNQTIKEDALYNYARLSYEVGNIAESPSLALNRYLRNYPNSLHKSEIYQLLVESYLTSNDYIEVMRVLDSTDLNSYKMKVLYQKAAYLQGVEYFDDERFGESKASFQKSINYGYNVEYRGKAKYWLAESEYRLGSFHEALVAFKAFRLEDPSPETPEAKMLPYNIGYTQFKLKNYAEAVAEFEAFLKTDIENDKLKNDTYLRLGDSYFMEAKYWPALENYNNSINLNDYEADYATYQKAVCYGLIGRNSQRIETLNSLLSKYPKSKLGDDALYLLGSSYTRANENEKALKSYKKIESKYPGSSYVPKAKLKEALIYYNSNKNSEALREYKEVVDKYPSTSEAKQAVAGSRKIYIDMGQASEYVSWVKTLDFVDITQAEADSTSYLAGEKAFMKGNCNQAKPSFKNYLKDFPKGISRLNAHFYLAQCEYQAAEYDKALINYESVLVKDNNEFTERSLVRSSEIYLKNTDTTKAISALDRLLKVAELPQNKTYADINLMRLYNGKGDLDKALESATIVAMNTKVSDKVKSEAELIIARGAMSKGDIDLAKRSYEKLMITSKGEVKAEAMYYNAYFLNSNEQYEESNKVIFEIASKYSGYKYWGAKSLLVMAKNFEALNDQYQAIYTLETIIKNFKFEDINNEARTHLSEIKAKSATQGESINTQN